MPRLNHLALVATLAFCVTLAQCVSGDRIVVTIENNGTDALLPTTVAPPAILLQDDGGGEEAIPDAIPEQEEAAIISSRRERLVNKVGTRIPERKHRWPPEKPTPGRVPAVCAPSNNNKVIIAPYLQSAGSNRMSIRWRTSTTGRSKGVVCFGTNPEDMTTVETAQTRYVTRQDVETWDTLGVAEHLVTLTDLAPSTTYYYAVAVEDADATASARAMAHGDLVPHAGYHEFRTFPDPERRTDAQDEPLRVWAVGDPGWGDHKAVRVRDAFVNFTGGDWDLTLGLGDLAYLKGKDWEYQKRFFKLFEGMNARRPVFTTPGNHDRYTCDMWNQTGPYFELFTNPGDGLSGGLASNHKSYYAFDYGNVHFVSVESDRLGLEDDPGLYAWLEADLKAARAKRYDWIVAFQHQPPYSKGSHDSDEQYECYKLRTNLVPLYEKYGVDLVLAGHSHSYERSHLLHGHHGMSDEVARNPGVIKTRWAKGADGVDVLEKTGCGEGSGTMYVVTGGAANRGAGPLNHPAMAFNMKNRGSMLLEFEPRELRMWLLGEHRDENDDYAGYTKILDAAVYKKRACAAP